MDKKTIEIKGKLFEKISELVFKVGPDATAELLEAVFDADEEFESCDDNQCDDEGCRLHKAAVNFLEHNRTAQEFKKQQTEIWNGSGGRLGTFNPHKENPNEEI